ncbi:hypothetical protein OS493_024231 [Desmophyllum pertusum]|uniref:Uncharacterized protein n=1 Tax=Desmophyllum pertusum TaxID=174260 RepID=A0A9W9ZBE6_9CNID|nr:hypothetical protein OS493_024231 [Desmophyllum pertusum]
MENSSSHRDHEGCIQNSAFVVSVPAVISVVTLSTLSANCGDLPKRPCDLGDLSKSHFTICDKLLDYFSGHRGLADRNFGCTCLVLETSSEGGPHTTQCT